MSRTFIRQTQSLSSSFYDDTFAPGATLESTAVSSSQDDFNALRSQVNRIIGGANWYDALQGTGRSLSTTDTALNAVESQPFLFRSQIFTDIPVDPTTNYVVLAVSASEAPTQTAAVGAVTTVGAVAASGSIGFHSLEIVSGSHALRPKNLVLIRSSSTGQVIQTSGSKDIYGLLVTEAPDGGTFNDTTQQVQLSFVMENAARNGLEAVPASEIGGKSIHYSYVRRSQFQNLNETSFLPGVFIDIPDIAGVTTNLDDAISNQGTTPAIQGTDIFVNMNDEVSWNFRDSTGASTILAVTASALTGGDAVILNTAVTEFNTTNLDVNNTNTANFSQGVSVDTTDQSLNLGVTAGQIDTAGVLTLKTAGGNNTFVSSSANIRWHDVAKETSGFVGNFLLSSASIHWNNVKSVFGEVSLLEMVYDSYNFASSSSVPRTKVVASVGININPDTDVNNANGLDTNLADYSGKDFVNDVNVYLNGILLRNGANAAANHDVYPGTNPATGDIRFEFELDHEDQITMEVF